MAGPYDTSQLERHFGVEIFPTSVRHFGWGMAKLEPLFLATAERCLILDSDVLFMGRVLDKLEKHPEDFVVVNENHPLEEIRRHYFNEEIVQRLYPSFHFPGYVFNTGQIVTTTGIFRRDNFAPFVSFDEPRQSLQSEVFLCGEQGLLNYVVLSALQEGSITVKREDFMRWAGGMQPRDIDTSRLTARSPYDIMVHWAGAKAETLSAAPMSYLLEFFEAEYHRGICRNTRPTAFPELRRKAIGLFDHLRKRSS
jgi:hypothetical protein